MEIQEKMISGYCRAQNRANTVCCEYEERPEGLVLTFADCNFRRCVHFQTCLLMKEAREGTLEED